MLWLLSAALMAAEASLRPTPADPSLKGYAQPRQLVALRDGRRINLFCLGSGSPTVIFTAGMFGWSAVWSKVQARIATRTRTCAWDRAGAGFSDPSVLPQNALQSTADLQQVLQRAGVNGPYVLVSYCAGSYETLLLTDHEPRAVAGMVLVDPSIPDQTRRLRALAPAFAAANTARLQQLSAHFRKCAAELAGGTLGSGSADADRCFDVPSSYPSDLRQALIRLDGNPARFLTRASAVEQTDYSESVVHNDRRSYGAIPLVVLTASDALQSSGIAPPAPAERSAIDSEWRRSHDQLAGLSTDGTDIVVPDSNDLSPDVSPGVIIAAVDEVLDELRPQANSQAH